MATPPISEESMREAMRYVREAGSVAGGARAAGIPYSTFKNRYRRAVEAGFSIDDPDALQNTFEAPPQVPDDIPIEDVIEMQTRRFEQRQKAAKAKKWQQIKVKIPGPVGLLWMGDPHVDDNGCDWPTLRHHIGIIQSSPAIKGCSLGDQQNAWVGRMAHLWAHQDTSQATANRMVEWLVRNMDPILLIGGNHDMWLGAGDPLTWMSRGANFVFENWRADVEFVFPGGRTCRVVAAHDLPGHSMWNQLHAQLRAARMAEKADLYISGHRHNWALTQLEIPEREQVSWLARARGYKMLDDYALRLGHGEQQHGHAIMQIIDPDAERETGFVQLFADVDHGADYLAWLRMHRGY